MNYHTTAGQKLLGRGCIVCKASDESVLVGKYGCVSPYNQDKYLVLFWSPQVARRWKVDITKGEEGGIVLDAKQAKLAMKDLKIFRSKQAQIDKLHGVERGEAE